MMDTIKIGPIFSEIYFPIGMAIVIYALSHSWLGVGIWLVGWGVFEAL